MMKKLIKIFDSIYWWIKYHTTHKYHIINISKVDPEYDYGWLDRDHVLLLACFKILCDFVEKESPNIGLKSITPEKYWGCSELTDDDRKIVENKNEREQSIRELYTYWKVDRPKALKDLNSIHTHELYYQESEKFDNKTQEMLHKLIDIRNCLWT